MITRIVRMEFREDSIVQFDALFSQYQDQIRHFPGCVALQLHEDPDTALVRYTHSKWQSTTDLEAYKNSDLFRVVWPQTKLLFGGKPAAYSLLMIKDVP
ncbi:MAG: antibiotic biosynthesis monooxygenase [Bacteroidia bacterium]|nr:antibiotic biosynthesis monooxygenase [Bacteroidia bacterium]